MESAFLTDILLPQLQDAEGTIEPPVLQLVCDALYDQAMEADTSTMGLLTYHALGDVRTWLESYLTDALRRFGPDQVDAREVLKALVTAAGTTKRAVGMAELTARLQTVGAACEADTLEAVLLPRLVQARLVRTDEAEGTSRYELIHEFLVPPIAAWMKADDRTPLAVLELIAQASERFKRTGLLLEREALQWIIPSEDRLSLSPEQQAFLARSKQAVRQQQRGLRLKVGALLLVAILSVGGVAVWRLYQAKQQLQATNQQLQGQTVEVDTQRQIAEASAQQAKHQLAALYTEQGRQELMQGKVLRAVAYLSAAYHLEETGSMLRFLLAQALRPLDAQLLSLGGFPLTSMPGHTDVVETASFSSDGMRLVTASRDGPAQVWDVASGHLLLSLEGHTAPVHSASFSPDGTRLVTASWDTTAKVWDVASGHLLLSLEGYTAPVVSASFSPDGTRLVTVSRDTTAKVWDVASGHLLLSLEGHTGLVLSASFSPDGTRLVTASNDKTAKVWDVASGHLLLSLEGHTAQWSPRALARMARA